MASHNYPNNNYGVIPSNKSNKVSVACNTNLAEGGASRLRLDSIASLSSAAPSRLENTSPGGERGVRECDIKLIDM